jgi:hypothetical protein
MEKGFVKVLTFHAKLCGTVWTGANLALPTTD